MRTLFLALLIASMATLSCTSSDGKKTAESKTDSLAQKNENSEGKPVYLTKALFLEQVMDYETNPEDWVYKGKKPGLIDFYADWCRPCKMTSPILDELAAEYAGRIIIYKVNVDQERELASVFGIQSIPTFLFMPLDANPSMSSGIAQTPEQTKEMFRQQIEQVLLGEPKQ
ncbi:MAG: thioredoxin [Bacteroidota bacterium]|nr:MAG: thioredoxin [Bacteroidota bacterium]